MNASLELAQSAMQASIHRRGGFISVCLWDAELNSRGNRVSLGRAMHKYSYGVWCSWLSPTESAILTLLVIPRSEIPAKLRHLMGVAGLGLHFPDLYDHGLPRFGDFTGQELELLSGW